jgi:hypothetical protein
MSFEGTPHETTPDFEKEGVEHKSIESIPGPLPELLRLNFDTKQIEFLTEDVLKRSGVDLEYIMDAISSVEESRAQAIIDLCSDYFELEGDIEREDKGQEIIEAILNK